MINKTVGVSTLIMVQFGPTVDKNSYQLSVVRPVWLPYNDIGHETVTALVRHFGYPASGPRAEKYAVVLASLLKAAQALLSTKNNKT